MFGIGFLLLLAVVVGIVRMLTRGLSPRAKLAVWLGLAAFAGSVPFWHHAYPSYRQYLALCARPDLYSVTKTVEVDYPYVDGDSFAAYNQVVPRGFKGFDLKRGDLGYFRYSKKEGWSSAACQRDCADPSEAVWERTCKVNCLTSVHISEPEFKTRVESSIKELVEGRIVEQRGDVLGPSGEGLAVQHWYSYLPYGNGWGKILGAASGSAPALTCRPEKSIFSLEFLRPRVSL
jgi:hypothetical protein